MDRPTFVRRLTELAAKIDLGQSYGDCAPCEAGGLPNKKYFPSIYISGQAESVKIPESGKATIEYRVTGRSMNERDGKQKHSADIEVQSIEAMDNPKKKGPKEGEPARLLHDLRPLVGLDRQDARRPSQAGSLTSFDDRSRNDMGQFIGNETGGVDPNSMAAAYGTAPLPEPPAMSESHLARIKKFFTGRRNQS